MLSLQADVAQAVAREVDVQLTPLERQDFAHRRQVEPEVFLLDLEGRHFVARRTEDGFRRALGCFQRAIQLDPTFAPAHAGLAEAYAMLGNYGIAPPREVHAPARAAAERALELDPGLAEARRTLALLKWQFEFDWTGAEEEYRRALALGPHSALAHWWHGTFYGIQGRFEECRSEHERALALDPLALNVVAVMGWMLYFARRHREALSFYRRVLEVDPDHLMGRWFLGEALIELGEWDEGLRELEAAVALSKRGSRFLGYLGYALGRAGRTRRPGRGCRSSSSGEAPATSRPISSPWSTPAWATASERSTSSSGPGRRATPCCVTSGSTRLGRSCTARRATGSCCAECA